MMRTAMMQPSRLHKSIYSASSLAAQRFPSAKTNGAPVSASGLPDYRFQATQPKAVLAASDLPLALQAGIERLSGVRLDGVQVERNSPEPGRLGAHATAQRRTIKLAPGQDHRLPQEAWHGSGDHAA